MPELAAHRLSVSFFRQGSVPAVTSFFAANRASRASAKVMSGNFPKVSVPRRPPRRPTKSPIEKQWCRQGSRVRIVRHDRISFWYRKADFFFKPAAQS